MNFIKKQKLIVLPCHSIWTPGPTLGELRDEWALASFQLDGNDHLCFKEHVIKSILELKHDNQAVLIISGGQTKEDSGPILESLSYFQLGSALAPQDWEFYSDSIFLEEYARDSFENVLFLICRFYEIFQYYPSEITVVGFEFKRQRFIEQHLHQALKFPRHRIHYVGNNPNPSYNNKEDRYRYFKDLDVSEARHARELFEKDWYGCHDPLLTKKTSRNPFRRSHGYSISNPSISSFLTAIASNNELDSEEIRRAYDLPWAIEN
ncbi:CIC11C00000001970 [Sungouiella intermedia]|uniref:CIC11C00000001970 n=1 Tax=Sungouiella intermedia TaxID=45354 RepID=A0A1L0DPP0_9ASCO|nr:CIC11C00000001970 [[Candida] intermedia]